MAYRMRDYDLAGEVEVTIEALREWRLEEATKFAQLALDVIRADSPKIDGAKAEGT